MDTPCHGRRWRARPSWATYRDTIGDRSTLFAAVASAWDHCRPYLEPGGLFLAKASHGDASLAGLDPSVGLVQAVLHRDGVYRLDDEHLDTYLVPKSPRSANCELIRRSGRSIACTKPAFAHLF